MGVSCTVVVLLDIFKVYYTAYYTYGENNY